MWKVTLKWQMTVKFKFLKVKINNQISYKVVFNVLVQEVLKLWVIVQGLQK